MPRPTRNFLNVPNALGPVWRLKRRPKIGVGWSWQGGGSSHIRCDMAMQTDAARINPRRLTPAGAVKQDLVILIMCCLLSAGEAAAREPGTIAVKKGDKIAFMGDSITAAGKRKGGYCQLVLLALKDQGIETKAVFAGISGHKSNQMLARLEKDVLAHKPDWLTLSCGVNDVWHGKRGVDLESYKKNIAEIVKRAQAAGVKVMLLTSTMIKEDQGNALNQKLVAYNDFLRTLAKEKGCLLADLNADMQAALKTFPADSPKGKQLTRDGVHMNRAGNIMMAKGVAKAFGLTDQQLDKSSKSW